MKRKKVLSGLLAFAMTASLFAGCGNAAETTSESGLETEAGSAAEAGGSEAEEASAGGEAEEASASGYQTTYGSKQFDDVTIQVELFDRENAPEGSTITDNKWTKYIQDEMKKVGINVEFVAVPRADEVDKLTSMMAGGIAPDIVLTYTYSIAKDYYDQGGVWDLSEFVDGEGQAENLKETAAYQDHNTYLYRNLIKTVEDYGGLSAGGVRADLGIGIRELASYNYEIWFQLIFLFVLSWFVVSAERKKGFFLLTKGTKRGHVPLAGAKLLTMVSAGGVYTALQESGTFLMLGYLYGYGDVAGKIQSISIFRDCAAPVTIGQAMAVLFVVRLLTGMLCTVFIA